MQPAPPPRPRHLTPPKNSEIVLLRKKKGRGLLGPKGEQKKKYESQGHSILQIYLRGRALGLGFKGGVAPPKDGNLPNPRLWIYSWLVADFTILSAQLTRRLGPGEGARERRHPSDARLECSFYAQLL